MNDQKIILIQGDARSIPLADNSVQCVVTSPPYWSLRNYGLQPTVWGDDSCEHEWGDPHSNNATNHTDKRRWQHTRNGRDEEQPTEKRVAWLRTPVNQGQMCHKCGAWFGCLGLEPTPELFIEHMVGIFREVRRVLREDGTCWLNIGDSYNASNGGTKNGIGEAYGRSPDKPGHDRACRVATSLKRNLAEGFKPKDLVGIPWMLAFALRADGWYLRQEIIWSKPNPMPESVTDRCTKAHEQVFLLTKSARYFYDADAIREPVTSTGGASIGKQDHSVEGTKAQSRAFADPAERNHPLGRNKRSVWTIATQSFPEAHFATYPVKLVNPCIQAGTSEKGCCPKCAAPWKRVVDRVREFRSGSGQSGNMPVGKNGANLQGGGDALDVRRGPTTTITTISWVPSCNCNAGEKYCTACCTVIGSCHDRASATTTHQMRRVQEMVCSKEGREKVLSGGMLPDAAAHTPRPEMHSVQNCVPSSEQSATLLREVVRPAVVCGTKAGDEGLVQNHTRIHPHSSTVAPQGEQGGICDGTQAGDGEEAGTFTESDRDCSSSERQENRQPRVESGDHDEETPRSTTKANLPSNLPTLQTPVPDQGPCPHCGSSKVISRPAIQPCLVLDPFSGAATTGVAAKLLGRSYIGIEPKSEYVEISRRRLAQARHGKVKRRREKHQKDEQLLFA